MTRTANSRFDGLHDGVHLHQLIILLCVPFFLNWNIGCVIGMLVSFEFTMACFTN